MDDRVGGVAKVDDDEEEDEEEDDDEDEDEEGRGIVGLT